MTWTSKLANSSQRSSASTTNPIPADIQERLIGFLCDPGMVLPDGTPKPAWDVFLDNAPGITSTSIDVPVAPASPALALYPNPVRAGASIQYSLPSVACRALHHNHIRPPGQGRGAGPARGGSAGCRAVFDKPPCRALLCAGAR